MNSLIEQIREEAINDLFKIKGYGPAWLSRREFLRGKLPDCTKPTRRDLIGLGSSLSEAFKLGGSGDRSQSSLSSAGSTWEALVVWYLNACLAGTHAVCVRGAPLCPQPIKDSLSICFENSVLRSEPDVLLFSSTALALAPREKSRSNMLAAANQIVGDEFGSIGVINMQCKTNWNDNAQIPMLWNMLYNQARKGAVIPNGFTIGRNGFSLGNLGHFGYSFVTVPTQGKGPIGYKTTSLEVMRAKTMTAGNYWGYPTINGVCSSLAELFNFFTRNPKIFPNVANIGRELASAIPASSSQRFNLDALRFS
jgi:hypothetical protein